MSRYSHETTGTTIALYGAAFAVGLGLAWGQGELTDSMYGPDKAKAYAEQNGNTNVEVTDTDTVLVGLTGCDEKDSVKYEMSAVSPTGIDVKLLVCKGIFKGATIRQG